MWLTIYYFLYGLLGGVLALAGVGPLGFIAIMAVVMAIDIASKVNC